MDTTPVKVNQTILVRLYAVLGITKLLFLRPRADDEARDAIIIKLNDITYGVPTDVMNSLGAAMQKMVENMLTDPTSADLVETGMNTVITYVTSAIPSNLDDGEYASYLRSMLSIMLTYIESCCMRADASNIVKMSSHLGNVERYMKVFGSDSGHIQNIPKIREKMEQDGFDNDVYKVCIKRLYSEFVFVIIDHPTNLREGMVENMEKCIKVLSGK